MSKSALKLPPNQQLAAPGKWPVVGERAPRKDDAPWSVSFVGLVVAPQTWTLEELNAMPQAEQTIDIHCVTRWSKPGAKFAGVPLARLLDACGPLPQARFLSFVARSERGHSTSLPLTETVGAGALVALRYEGEPLEEIHGGPVRVVVPGRYFYKSLKWLERVDVLAEDRLGYWEQEAGYHNEADPWREQRYIAPNLDRRTLADALARRDFRGRDFRSLDATGLDLAGLDARGALLRDAVFRHVNLAGARFDEANLSNAHLEGANLSGASFKGADVEGADFRGANLRGTDFSGASMIAATFVDEGDAATFVDEVDEGDAAAAALFDTTTRVDESAIEALTPAQRRFVRGALGRNV